jgi:N6-adenosine-specific RNA methylase IME4
MKFHTLANIFPLIEGDAFDALRDDIKANGLHDQIVMLDDAILDGRNRYRACKAARVDIPRRMIRSFNPKTEGDPLAWVISKNLQRRHLNESQRAWVAAKIANIQLGDNQYGSANLRTLAVSQANAAKMLSVGMRNIQNATAIRNNENVTPELIAAVEQGKISINLAKQAASLPAADQREIAARAVEGDLRIVKKVVKRKARAKRERDLGRKQRALPNKKYGVIYADPEWKFKTFSEDGKGSTAAENHYPTSDIEAIKARDVASIAADDCVLFMWATAPMLDQQIDVLKAWGFTYTTNMVWEKTEQVGHFGYWFYNMHELVLIGTKGNIPAPAPGTQFPSVFRAPVRAHSQKPDIVYEIIEKYFPSLTKIELNARAARKGWDSWGWEAPEKEAAE